MESKDLQFVWSPKFSFDHNSQNETKEIFAQVLYDHYDPPDFIPNYYFKTGATYEKNEMRRATYKWLEYFDNQLKTQRTNNILVMWGGDFSHTNRKTFETLGDIITILK